jgi:hypothetical protein
MQTPFAIFPVLQAALLFATLEFADGDVLGHSCDRHPEPIKHLPEHGILPGDSPYDSRLQPPSSDCC